MALVITLIMLSVVTVMAIVFLGMSRREKTSVRATADLTDAKLAADAGAARAQAEVLARIAAQSNLFAYDLTVSTNLINPRGFQAGIPDPANPLNVNYTYENGAPLNNNDLYRNLANLLYDPRPPVFVVTNLSTRSSEFRYYLDINRNGRFETNGYVPVFESGLFKGTNFYVGDPQWIGILEHPDLPHSPTNLFIARYAYLVVPAGKTLDLNFIHNTAKHLQFRPLGEGFYRNQGVGSWELNLAGFFQSLLPAYYNAYLYQENPGIPSLGSASLDALEILRYRYSDNLGNLKTAANLFGAPGVRAFQYDNIDDYSDGPLVTALAGSLREPSVSPDVPALPWPGSDNPAGYVNPQELFDSAKTEPSGTLNDNLTDRLLLAGNNTATTDYQYAFTRLLAQLGTESKPATHSRLLGRRLGDYDSPLTLKINPNYYNLPITNYANGVVQWPTATSFLPWTNVTLFTSIADRLLRAYYGTGLGLDEGILIYPTNLYSAGVHRLMQVAANICDTTTNRVANNGFLGSSTNDLWAPSVFRPVFNRRNGTNIFLVGFQEATNAAFLGGVWVDLFTNQPYASLSANASNFVNIHGIPWVIGVKKGFPSFNEFHLQTSVQVTRRMQARKTSVNDASPVFRQAYEIGVSNLFGLEAWNSYARAFPRDLELRWTNLARIGLRDGTVLVAPMSTAAPVIRREGRTNIAAGTWLGRPPNEDPTGRAFRLPITNGLVWWVPDMDYSFTPPTLRTQSTALKFNDPTPGYPVPQWKLEITNRLVFAIIDQQSGRLLDFVNLDNMRSSLDIAKQLGVVSNTATATTEGRRGLSAGSFWITNRVANGMTVGITNQIFVSTNDSVLSVADWRRVTEPSSGFEQREAAVEKFRRFMNVTNGPALNDLVAQVPFTPSRKIDLQMSWQANDPLVHYHLEDLYSPFYTDTNNVVTLEPEFPAEPSNLSKQNSRYSPWDGAGKPDPKISFNPAYLDPLISKSDDWAFPTNKFPNIGWLGRVHRGTPWQTIYLKSGMAEPREWARWVGGQNPNSALMRHPTNDWQMLELFTTAVHENAARGLLSVNQTNLAAWAAVLTGVPVLTNSNPANLRTKQTNYGYAFVEPASWQLSNIVQSINTNRLLRPGGSFRYLGEVLSAPALTVESPFLNVKSENQRKYGIGDEVYERIPQQILSLLKEDEPYVVIYSYGQSLKPADRSRVTLPGTYFNLCTNYQITGEVLTKTALRFDELRRGTNLFYRGVVESYNLLPND